MSRSGTQGPGRIARALFRVALYAFPTTFRARFGGSLLEAFEDGYAERGPERRMARWGFAARSLASVVFEGLRERLRPRYRVKQRQMSQGRGTMGPGMTALGKDLGFAVRSLARRPGFTLVAVATLGLGIGANAAIFAVVDGVLLEPLPYPEADGILSIRTITYDGEGSMSYPDIVDLLEQADGIETLVGINGSSPTLSGLGDPEVILISRVTDGLLETFRLTPALGRDVRADEFGPEGPAVAMISHGFWRERFGADADVLGKTFELTGVTYEVVGVAPPEFDYPSGTTMWIPRRLNLEGCGRGCHTMTAIGRVAAGATVESVQAEAEGIAINLQRSYPDTNNGKLFDVTTLQGRLVRSVETGLVFLLGAVGLVLLIACVNVANLLLVRASARSNEFAVRTALGASRSRLMAQSLAESLVLATIGGALGLGLAKGTIAVLPALAGSSIPRLDQVSLDASVIGISTVAVVFVTLLFGLAPALATARSGVQIGIKSHRSDGTSHQRLRTWLLAGEVALSAVLLVGAGLLLRSFQELYAVDLGFETEEVTRFSLTLPATEYETLDEVRLFYRTLEERLRELPGVLAVGSAWSGPLGSSSASGTVLAEGRPNPAPEDEVEANVHPTGPHFLETIGLEIARGRGLLPSDDDPASEPVVLINERLVDLLFPSEDPLGRRISSGVGLGFGAPDFFRVVGIVRDAQIRSLTDEPRAGLWIPHGHYGPRNMAVHVRTAADSPPLIPRAREIVQSLDPDLPLYRIETVAEAVAREVAPTRFYMVLAVAFGALAAVLAAVGLYGVAAYAASRRTREIGLRVALGADRRGIVRLVLGQGARPAGWGLVVGLAGAFYAGRLAEAVIFGVEPRDPTTFVGVATLLVGVTVLATLLPARRASRIDPVIALRTD